VKLTEPRKGRKAAALRQRLEIKEKYIIYYYLVPLDHQATGTALRYRYACAPPAVPTARNLLIPLFAVSLRSLKEEKKVINIILLNSLFSLRETLCFISINQLVTEVLTHKF